MAGQMGNETATMLNLEVLEILADDNAVRGFRRGAGFRRRDCRSCIMRRGRARIADVKVAANA